MEKNRAIDMAIKAIHKVKPSLGDSKMGGLQRESYEEWMDVIRTLQSLKDDKKERKNVRQT